MASNIDPSVPVQGNPTTLSVRDNFQAAADEVSALQAADAALEPRVTQNETDIGTNTSAIIVNNDAIGVNKADIATNTADILTNTSAIGVNTGDISTNTSAIGVNEGDISTNTSAIGVNTADIATNTADIAALESGGSDLGPRVTQNEQDIATNVSDITNLENNYVPESRSVSSGTGLSGGGNLSVNRTLSVDSTVITTSSTQQKKSGKMSIGTSSSVTGTNSSLRLGGTIQIAAPTSGGATILGDVAGQIVIATSDIRLKENITENPHGLDAVLNAETIAFDWKDGAGHEVGFHAQQLIGVIPEAVIHTEDDKYHLKSGVLTAVLFKAVQELTARVTELEAGDS
jgi:hypothetical protein